MEMKTLLKAICAISLLLFYSACGSGSGDNSPAPNTIVSPTPINSPPTLSVLNVSPMTMAKGTGFSTRSVNFDFYAEDADNNLKSVTYYVTLPSGGQSDFEILQSPSSALSGHTGATVNIGTVGIHTLTIVAIDRLNEKSDIKTFDILVQ